ncbi:MAG TPA: DUF255 domain-containing protein [Longimicrobiales bacterium]
MSDNFRFSPRMNRAHEIQWRDWGPRAFADAVAANKPVLLNLTAVWCHWCHLMDETTYSDPALIALINDNFIAIRVDADKHPHVQDRYIAGGWPTNAFLTPTGEVLWSGTYVPPEQFDSVAQSVISAWRERHIELQQEIERRRKAMQAARGRHHLAGLVRREAADDVLAATIDGYDSRNGGFGTDPKFPYIDAVELLYAHGQRGSADLLRMADHTLDGMLAGELLDTDGGFFRYAIKEDWTEPRREKLLSANAWLLRIYALGAQLRGRAEWRACAENIVRWANEKLRRSDGLWAGSQPLDDAAPDDVLYTSYNAQWISALADAGARLGESAWIAQANSALETLTNKTRVPDGLFRHYDDGGSHADHAVLLVDVVEVCRAFMQLAQVTGRNEYIDQTRELVRIAEKQLWAEDGGFWDCAKPKQEVPALRYRDKPFDTNADFARILNDLALLTGDKSYRALAERVLALLSPQAGRYGPAAANFALAVEEFFDALARVVIVGNGAGAESLRNAALRAPVVLRRVLTLPAGGRIAQFNFPAGDSPAAFVVNAKGASSALHTAEQLESALARG